MLSLVQITKAAANELLRTMMLANLRTSSLVVLLTLSASAAAKLPAPSDEAKAKAAEDAALTAHNGKVANFQLCKSMDRVAQRYLAEAKKAGKAVTPSADIPPCADPGAFVYTPPAPLPVAATVAATGAAPATPAAPSAPATPASSAMPAAAMPAGAPAAAKN